MPFFCLSVLSEMRAPRGNKHTRVDALSFHFATNKNFLHRVCATPNNSCEELLYARSVSGNKTDVRVTQRSRYAGDRGSHFMQGKGLFYARFAVYDMVEKEAIRMMILNTHFCSPALKPSKNVGRHFCLVFRNRFSAHSDTTRARPGDVLLFTASGQRFLLLHRGRNPLEEISTRPLVVSHSGGPLSPVLSTLASHN